MQDTMKDGLDSKKNVTIGEFMLKAITFDFWQTLYADSLENWKRRQVIRVKKCHDYLNSQGYSCGISQVEIGMDDAYNVAMSQWYRHKGVSVETCMMTFTETLQITLEETEIAAIIECLGSAFLASPPILIQHIKPVLANLSKLYPIGIISDSALTPGRYAQQLMERDDILQYFSVFTFSDETAHTKPEVIQFHSTLKALDAKPAEAVHIGDIVRTDIVGAKNAGMKAIRFEGINKSESSDRLSDAVIDDYRQLEGTIAGLSK